MAELEKQVTLQDLRAIIHGLNMSGLSFIEDGAVAEIKGMIKALPSPEALNKLTNTPDAIINLQKDIGKIMKLIDNYSKRDMEYKTNFKRIS